jgi:tRNA modification GTPase
MPPPTPALDTIAAISTPPGRGGIGIVRLSGPDALTIAAQLLQLSTPLDDPKTHAHARHARVLDPNNPAATIDDALVTAFHAPHSYTGDTVVEIAAHGSPVILDAILRNALDHGARLATPGEFTQRAFLSGRLDLTQAEAVHDLIAAQTLDQARVAAQQLGGALSRRVAPAKESLLYLIALLEAGMDFAAGELDDVDIVPPTQIAASIAAVQQPLQALAATFRRGQLLRNGAAIALIGPPNAGKSSLFNRLLDRDRAIVTPLPGTTRDTLEESLSLAGIPLRLIDTAGLRTLDPPPHPSSEPPQNPSSRPESSWLHRDDAVERPLYLSSSEPATNSTISPPPDPAEQQGIARSHEALADADLILLIHDATQPLTPAELHLSATLADPTAPRPHLLIHNKIDLLLPSSAPSQPLSSRPKPSQPYREDAAERPPYSPSDTGTSSLPQNPGAPSSPTVLSSDKVGSQNLSAAPRVEVGFSPLSPSPKEEAASAPAPTPIPTSALTGAGLDDLRQAILTQLGASGSLAATGLLNNLRQQEAITATLASLSSAATANASALPHELILLDLHTALRALDSLTGATTPDDILARIFSTFCIGK